MGMALQKRRIVERLGRWPGAVLHIRHPVDEPGWGDAAVGLWEGFMAEPPLPRGRWAIVRRMRVAPAAGDVYVKRLYMRSPWDVIKHFWRASRAMREWRGAELAAGAGRRVPVVRCVVVERVLGFVCGSMIVAEAVEGASPFWQELRAAESGTAAGVARRRMLLRLLADEVSAWHRAGVCHGEMHFGNVLCVEEAGGVAFVWLDHERTFRSRSVAERSRNLADLGKDRGLSLRERILFWHVYRRGLGLSRRKARRLRNATWLRIRRAWKQRGW
jgi:tRNA A-37 threonylcarbamoyl transferase component Bud32